MIESTTIYAQKLLDKMHNVEDPMGNYPMCFDTAKQCAIIALDEIIKELKDIRIMLSPGSYVSYKDYQRDVDGIQQDSISKLLFLGEVKRQLQAL